LKAFAISYDGRLCPDKEKKSVNNYEQIRLEALKLALQVDLVAGTQNVLKLAEHYVDFISANSCPGCGARFGEEHHPKYPSSAATCEDYKQRIENRWKEPPASP
jgi:hypothetical protein